MASLSDCPATFLVEMKKFKKYRNHDSQGPGRQTKQVFWNTSLKHYH